MMFNYDVLPDDDEPVTSREQEFYRQGMARRAYIEWRNAFLAGVTTGAMITATLLILAGRILP